MDWIYSAVLVSTIVIGILIYTKMKIPVLSVLWAFLTIGIGATSLNNTEYVVFSPLLQVTAMVITVTIALFAVLNTRGD